MGDWKLWDRWLLISVVLLEEDARLARIANLSCHVLVCGRAFFTKRKMMMAAVLFFPIVLDENGTVVVN